VASAAFLKALAPVRSAARDRFGHAEEDCDALAAAARRERLFSAGEAASSAPGKQLSMSCKLLPTQTLPAGSTSMSTCICRPPPTYPPGGEIGSPVFMPGGQFPVRTPHRCAIRPDGLAKFGRGTRCNLQAPNGGRIDPDQARRVNWSRCARPHQSDVAD